MKSLWKKIGQRKKLSKEVLFCFCFFFFCLSAISWAALSQHMEVPRLGV